jgi:hypothetical protein
VLLTGLPGSRLGDWETIPRRTEPSEGREMGQGGPILVVTGQGGLDPIVQVLGVPDGAVLFQELENFFQDRLGVGGNA